MAAVVLAGGRARRMAGVDKPAVPVGGRAMLVRVLAAVEDARPRMVVGPPTLAPLLPAGVSLTSEQPPGGGPVAGLAAGLAAVGPSVVELVAVLAADLPFLDAGAVSALGSALLAGPGDGAVFADSSGRPQWLAGVWRLPALRTRLDALGDPTGRSMREFMGGLAVVTVTAPRSGPPAWFDCDTVEDVRAAEGMANDHAG
jgi:molybdopterin-guanine dinucleotide biosynthesis protein A